ncbi:MAG: glycosyltransferase, partial [[Eubacterium] siraeum]|nr:glycosyltransferase [[Eubacterium] siraeum]
ITLDDDGQAPVESIYSLVEKIDEGFDVVFGRYPHVKQSVFRRLGSKVNDRMCEIMLGKPKGIVGNSFYAMKRFVSQQMVKYENSFPYIGGLVFQATVNVINIDVEQRERAEGRSGYTLGKLIKLWFNGFTAFSVKPLRISAFIGAVSALAGLIFGIVTVIRKFVNPDIIMGYSSLMAALLFIGGMIMLMLGMIGEYIGRIYICINNSPQYVIRETVNIESTREK